MKKLTIGILAHVDAGKTTFSEQLLFAAGAIPAPGRVDHQTARMDVNELEKQRGITVFADQTVFCYEDCQVYLIDTPGHVDFSSEMERAVSVLDYAILLIGGKDGVQSHTLTLFRLLESYGVPVFFFVNKVDLAGFSLDAVLVELRERLTRDVLPLADLHAVEGVAAMESIAEWDDSFLQAYLEERVVAGQALATLGRLIRRRACFPVMWGSALQGRGVSECLRMIVALTETDYCSATPFEGKIYKVRHDPKGGRVCFMKALSGCLPVRGEFSFLDAQGEEAREKVTELRVYSVDHYETRDRIEAGDVFAVTGLKLPACGSVLRMDRTNALQAAEYRLAAVLESSLRALDGTDLHRCLEVMRMLEDEDPVMRVQLQKKPEQLLVSVMGSVQLEILPQILLRRFGIHAVLEAPTVQYRETIAASVMGYGHFEPYRHYAEVHLRLQPTDRGSGISFRSECHVDDLPLSYQNLVRTHVFEKAHRGVLTGSPVTDVCVVLVSAAYHEKHTVGGDFREATYRAVRQALEKAQSILLEPFYRFEIVVPGDVVGRILSDLPKMRAVAQPPEQLGLDVRIAGRGPVRAMMEYPMALTSLTRGNGGLSFQFDGYGPCGEAQSVIQSIAYDKGADAENTSGSVFCSKGSSFVVNWDEAETYMHLPL